ncbi:MAG: threonylcarbamoyl-AMP synthase, partial [bacterium]|nr:threonylcarbamoyl-AMP synthase [bacterium]
MIGIDRAGRIVAFPTETVYGLGANALDADAVRKIFAAKRRPSTSPVIVHVASVEAARELVTRWPDEATALTDSFWPGPLTLVLPKRPAVPDIVTAGLPTVGVRMPSHRVALELLRTAGVPIAAPSANPFTSLSPTEAGHVERLLEGQVDFILDGGETEVGIESTVLSLAEARPVLLRPGMVTQAQIEQLIGPVDLGRVEKPAHPSPGMHPRHYSPKTPLMLVSSGELPAQGRGAYLWISAPADSARTIQMPSDPEPYAARLYSVLHELDSESWDWIAVETP